MAKAVTRTDFIPSRLKDAVEALGLSNIQKGHLYKFIGIIETKQNDLEKDCLDYVPLASSYIVETFNSRYMEWLKPAINANIIQENLFETLDIETGELTTCKYKIGSIKDGKEVSRARCKEYRINFDFLACSGCEIVAPVTYKDNNPVVVDKYIVINGENFSREEIINDIKLLKLDEDVLEAISVSSVLDIEEDFKNGKLTNVIKINDEITTKSFEVNNIETDKVYYTTLEKALVEAKALGASVIQYKKQFFIDVVEQFLARKQRNILMNNIVTLKKLCSKNIYAKRNETNNRLDTNLTSLSKLLFSKIVEVNNLVEIDLKNSQYAILADLLKNKNIKGKDVEIFKAKASEGVLYEYVQSSLGLTSRNQAKILMMEIIFSSHRNNSTSKKGLKEVFPNVVAFCDEYKKQNGDNSLAILLQSRESEIFIDKIYYRLKKQGVYVLTKHDSIIVKAADKSTAIKTIKEVFAEIEFNATINQEKAKPLLITIDEDLRKPLDYFIKHYGDELGNLLFENQDEVLNV